VDECKPLNAGRIAFDAALGVVGVALALSAAFDFRVAHARVANVGRDLHSSTSQLNLSRF
jgi:hypothetical protein